MKTVQNVSGTFWLIRLMGCPDCCALQAFGADICVPSWINWSILRTPMSVDPVGGASCGTDTDDGFWYQFTTGSKGLLACVRVFGDNTDVDLQIKWDLSGGIARPQGRTAAGAIGGISVHNQSHCLFGLPLASAGQSWTLLASSDYITTGLCATSEMVFRRQRSPLGLQQYACALFRSADLFWQREDTDWTVVRDDDALYITSGHAMIVPRDSTKVSPYALNPDHGGPDSIASSYLLSKLDQWEFVGIIVRAKAAWPMYTWSDDHDGLRQPAVVLLAEALLRTMDGDPGSILALEPLALRLLAADAKTMEDVRCVYYLPAERETVLRVCEAYYDRVDADTEAMSALRSGLQ